MRGWILILILAAVGVCLLGGARLGRQFPPAPARGVAATKVPTEGASPRTADYVQPRLRASRARPLPLPGEFERPSALMLGCNELVRHYPKVFSDVVAAAYRSTRIIGLISHNDQERLALELLEKRGLPNDAVRFVLLPLDTMWVRDYGPLFIRRTDGSTYVAKGDYTEQGEKKGKRLRDNEAARLLGESLGLPVVSVPLKLSGGNLLSNGEGICVTTVTLVSENLSAAGGKQKIADVLMEKLGFHSWVFVRPLVGESTGHVDMFMTFLAPNVAVVGRCDPAVDPLNARLLDETASLLSGRKTSRGPMKVYRIPMPPRRGEVWRSYTNVIFANGTLLMPTFKDVAAAMQEEALALYARLLPGWKVVGIKSDSLQPSRGLLHCFSMNVPPYVSLRKFGLSRSARPPTAPHVALTGTALPAALTR
ncbi:MAG: agmatine deiminase family protein [Phycisphaerae bacterium]